MKQWWDEIPQYKLFEPVPYCDYWSLFQKLTGGKVEEELTSLTDTDLLKQIIEDQREAIKALKSAISALTVAVKVLGGEGTMKDAST